MSDRAGWIPERDGVNLRQRAKSANFGFPPTIGAAGAQLLLDVVRIVVDHHHYDQRALMRWTDDGGPTCDLTH